MPPCAKTILIVRRTAASKGVGFPFWPRHALSFALQSQRRVRWRPAPAQSWRSFQGKFNRNGWKCEKLNSTKDRSLRIRHRSWRNTGGCPATALGALSGSHPWRCASRVSRLLAGRGGGRGEKTGFRKGSARGFAPCPDAVVTASGCAPPLETAARLASKRLSIPRDRHERTFRG